MVVASVSAEAKARHEPAPKKSEQPSKGPFGDIPKGPIEIFVSIDQQKLHLYSDGAHIADTSIATGVPSLPTPLGVFSVIQKQVFHRSNIYSGAPMPFMQRITWSGVALHEGESIGHRASHGCIRMPGEFARRLYALTKIGARVIVANEELRPTEFSDPHLFVHKVPAPPPAAAPAVAAESAPASSDSKPATLTAAPKPEVSAAAQSAKPVSQSTAAEPPKMAPAAEDAKPAETPAKPGAEQSSGGTAATPEPVKVAQSASGDGKPAEASATKTEAPAENQPAAQANQTAATVQAATVSDPPKPAQSSEEQKIAAEAAKVEIAAPAAAPVSQTSAPPVPQAAVLPLVQQQPSPSVKEAGAVQASSDGLRGTEANPTLVVAAPDSASPMPENKPADAAPAPVYKKTPIAIFISRKTQRIYVRQDFEPIFEAAITIDHPEQPVGTHVFTAMSYLADNSTFRWDVVSMPGAKPKVKRTEAREIIAYDRYGRPHRERIAEKPAVEPPPPATPAEALARIQIPQDVIDRISAMILPGSSLIISDQGLGEETGEGTDFVVVTSKS